jgi:Flp pilus assembly protein TadG
MERGRGEERGAQFLELGFALPILLLLILGIWDFGSAFALKQKLTNAGRDATRIAVSTPENASCTLKNVPCRIASAADAAKKYLENAGVDASCLDPTSPSSNPGYQDWVYSCGGMTLEINRGDSFLDNGVLVPATEVTLQYPISWKLGQMLPSVFPTVVGAKVEMPNLTP